MSSINPNSTNPNFLKKAAMQAIIIAAVFSVLFGLWFGFSISSNVYFIALGMFSNAVFVFGVSWFLCYQILISKKHSVLKQLEKTGVLAKGKILKIEEYVHIKSTSYIPIILTLEVTRPDGFIFITYIQASVPRLSPTMYKVGMENVPVRLHPTDSTLVTIDFAMFNSMLGVA
jgi:hypothetical protein